jgi:hypothetical protein
MYIKVRRVKTEDWEAVYFNNRKAHEAHHIPIEFICDKLQSLIVFFNEPITEIKGESYYLNDWYAEAYGFPVNFDDIPEDMFE